MKHKTTRRRTKKKQPNWLGSARAKFRNVLSRVRILLRAFPAQRSPRRMQLIERVALNNKQSVSLLRVDNQEFVIGCTGENIVLLGVHGSESEVPAIPTAKELITAFRSVQ